MTVAMHDARNMLSEAGARAVANDSLTELLDADDTLLIGAAGPDLEEYLRAVSEAGAEYGLQLHWDKFQYVAIGEQRPINLPDGSQLQPKPSMTYLGGLLASDGAPYS